MLFLKGSVVGEIFREVLKEEQINEKFDMDYHTKHVDTIFKRVFGE